MTTLAPIDRGIIKATQAGLPLTPAPYAEVAAVIGLTEAEVCLGDRYRFGGALLGRFVGAWVLTKVSPGKVLMTVATGAITLILISANTAGAFSGWALLAIGLMNAIMFPTIFSLASEGLGARAAEGSGVIATAIVGGAIVPPLTGMLADATGSLHLALTLPALCYVVIAGFGLYARRPAAEIAGA